MDTNTYPDLSRNYRNIVRAVRMNVVAGHGLGERNFHNLKTLHQVQCARDDFDSSELSVIAYLTSNLV
jgi:hypothetical protein